MMGGVLACGCRQIKKKQTDLERGEKRLKSLQTVRWVDGTAVLLIVVATSGRWASAPHQLLLDADAGPGCMPVCRSCAGRRSWTSTRSWRRSCSGSTRCTWPDTATSTTWSTSSTSTTRWVGGPYPGYRYIDRRGGETLELVVCLFDPLSVRSVLQSTALLVTCPDFDGGTLVPVVGGGLQSEKEKLEQSDRQLKKMQKRLREEELKLLRGEKVRQLVTCC